MKIVKLTNGSSCFVDDDKFDLLNQKTWTLHTHGYAHRSIIAKRQRRIVYLHHEVIGHPTDNLVVDHINGNKLDNQRQNLRFVTQTQNLLNNTSKGVRQISQTSFQGYFQFKRLQFTKCFPTYEQAKLWREQQLACIVTTGSMLTAISEL